MNIKFRYKIGLVVGVLATAYLFGRCQRGMVSPATSSSGPNRNAAVVLPQNDKEQILIDPIHHKITIKTGIKTSVVNLPVKTTVVDIHKDGSVKVTATQLGLETLPFIGLVYGDQPRVMVGADMLYYKKLDLGPMLTFPLHNKDTMRVGVKISYNVWSNIQLAVGYDNKQAVSVGVTIRL